jgi:transcriptional regulator with XRE-family HTH domain
MNKFGSTLKKVRVFNGLTQQQVADKLFLSLKAYQNLEHGITKIDFDRVEQLSGILGVTPNDLLHNSDLGLKFEKVKINSANNHLDEESDVFRNVEFYKRVIKEKEEEIAFLRHLLAKLCDISNHFCRLGL